MSPSRINVLIACEESQAETMAFRDLGFNAFSCDIKPARKGTPKEWHIIGDVRPYLNGRAWFITENGERHRLKKWHLIIAHPPCTYICKVGSVWMWNQGKLNQQRYTQMQKAVSFFYECLNASAQFVAVENPIPMKRAQLPRPTCYADPSWFGVKYTKKTLYWLRNLPPLMPTVINPDTKCFVRSSRGHYRSRTFPEMAKAIANQWGDYVLKNL